MSQFSIIHKLLADHLDDMQNESIENLEKLQKVVQGILNDKLDRLDPDPLQLAMERVMTLQKENRHLSNGLQEGDERLKEIIQRMHNLEVTLQNEYGVSPDKIREWKTKP